MFRYTKLTAAPRSRPLGRSPLVFLAAVLLPGRQLR